jgi:phosphoribosylformylglycinamidine synthase
MIVRGYHKPIMIAGGLGNVRRPHVEKRETSWSARRWSCSAARRC